MNLTRFQLLFAPILQVAETLKQIPSKTVKINNNDSAVVAEKHRGNCIFYGFSNQNVR